MAGCLGAAREDLDFMVEVVFTLGFYCGENLVNIGSLSMPGKGSL